MGLKLLLLSLSLTFSNLVFAEGAGSGFSFKQRAEKRESSRWTLESWLQKRDTMRLQDIWLSLNSPSPFEGSIFGFLNSFTTESAGAKSEVSYQSVGFNAFAQVLGIQFQFDDNTSQKIQNHLGQINLRLIGNSIQSSNLTVHYGLKTQYQKSLSPEVRINQQYAGISLQLYLQKYFGVDGQYRFYNKTTTDGYGETAGSRYEYGLFIDFKALRVFGGSFSERTNFVAEGSSTTDSSLNVGTQTGLKLFF
jgi:hypothetical protein